MSEQVRIRSYQTEDLPKVKALDAQVQPYRPEDELEVEAMYQRATMAMELGDRWIPQTPPTPDIELAASTYVARWVAVLPLESGDEQVVGVASVDEVGVAPLMPLSMPLAQHWRQRNDIAELLGLRVLTESRRQGIATRLTQMAIDGCRDKGFHSVVVNTTSAQIPALNLYQKLGFREVGRSYVGKFELVWHELAL